MKAEPITLMFIKSDQFDILEDYYIELGWVVMLTILAGLDWHIFILDYSLSHFYKKKRQFG